LWQRKKPKEYCHDKFKVYLAVLSITAKESAPTAAEINQLVFLFNAGRLAELENHARLLVEQYPDSGFAWNVLCVALQSQGKDALPAMQKLAELFPDDADAHSNLGNALLDLGQLDGAVASYRRVLEIKPDYAELHSILGNVLRDLGKLDDAAASCRRALEINPKFAEAHGNLGNALRDLGQLDAAVASYRRMLEIKPDIAEAHSNLGNALRDLGQVEDAVASYRRALMIKPDYAEAYSNLGNALHDLGQLEGAVASYRRAQELKPDYAGAHFNLGVTLNDLGQQDGAMASYCRALEINPDFADAHYKLGILFAEAKRLPEAEVFYRRALELKPDYAEIHRNLGNTLLGLDRLNEAEVSLRRAIALNPEDADSFVTFGKVLIRANRMEEGYAMYRRAQQIQPLVLSPGKKKIADFSVLLLQSPGILNTPVDYLVGRNVYDSHFLFIVPDTEYDIDFLRTKADVVINLISDPDSGKDVLPFALDIADRIGCPTVNHPRHIMGTDRETIAGLLSGIALCRIPKTVRLSSEILSGADWHKHIEGFTMPILIRCAGTHGGDDFEKIDDLGAIGQFVSRHPESDFYISEFVDYRSADGYYRKYRLFCINDEILPYHLAIHDHWMVHHFRTDMANQEWMRKEEEAFLQNPHLVFSKEHYIALKEVAKAIGLDYCGIDCALDCEGNIVVFEANATMLVHDETIATFGYKNPYIAKIKENFDAMLERLSAIW
jgi:tetratricopeptide (TPR) repeat protein/glutathione synthase/RimK-type ligase-like ATP-grasp enzyme